jgi:hypothetical protein
VEGSPCFLLFFSSLGFPWRMDGRFVYIHVCSKLGQTKKNWKKKCRSISPNQCWSVIIIILLSKNVWVVFFGPHRYQFKNFQKKEIRLSIINFIVKIMPWITNSFGYKKKKKPSIMHKDQFSNIHLESH